MAASQSFTQLSEQPRLGIAVNLSRAELAGLRKWQVKGFETFLIFYQLRDGGVSIVRVLHASQDWWSLLGIL